MVRSHRNSICDTCVQISRSYEFFDIFAYIVVISRKLSNQLGTRFVTFLHKTRGDMSFVKFFTHTVEISCKTIKTVKNTLSDICAQNSRRDEFCDFLAPYYNCISKNVKETRISASSRHKYHKSCS